MEFERLEAGYERRTLVRGDDFEVVECRWSQGQESKQHGHGMSSCMVYVQEGEFLNQSFWSGEVRSETFVTAQTIVTPVGVTHSLRCLSGNGRTLHVYSPPLADPKSVVAHTGVGDLRLSEEAMPLASLMRTLRDVKALSVPTHSSRFMNQLFSGVHPEALLADQVASQTRTTLATREASPVLSEIEDEVVEALGREIGWGNGQRAGVSVPGGSMANFMALHLARQALAPTSKSAGLKDVGPFATFVSEQAHYSLKKAAVVLGFGIDSVVAVRSNAAGRMDVKHLEKCIQEAEDQGRASLAVVATSGTTVLGAFDPITEIHAITESKKIWLHVDAAWGGPALFTDRLKAQVKGIHLADSVTFDAHKLFGSSLTSSFLLTRHRSLLLDANDVSGADYLFHEDQAQKLDIGRISWQCGRGPDALSFWTLWKSRGTSGLSRMVDRLLDVRDELVSFIVKEPRLSLVADPSYLNVCVRIDPPKESTLDSKDWAVFVRTRLMEEKKAWVNYARDQDGRSFLRMILVHPDLNFSHAKELLTDALSVR